MKIITGFEVFDKNGGLQLGDVVNVFKTVYSGGSIFLNNLAFNIVVKNNNYVCFLL